MNEFGHKTRELFQEVNFCMNCERVDLPLQLHHCYSKISSSPLNAIVLCTNCHKIGDCFNRVTGIKGRPVRIKFLKKTFAYLIGTKEYKFTTYDKIFMEKIGDDLQEILKESII